MKKKRFIFSVVCFVFSVLLFIPSRRYCQESPEKEDIERKTVSIELEDEKYLTLRGFVKGVAEAFELEYDESILDSEARINVSGTRGFLVSRTLSLALGEHADIEINNSMLQITYLRKDLEEVKKRIRNSLKLLILRIFQEKGESLGITDKGYGIRQVTFPDDAKPCLLLVHGLDSSPERFRNMIDVFKNKFSIYTFRYKNDQGIARSAEELASEIEKIPSDSIHVCTTSMGGLVVREYISTPELYKGNVTRFLMIVPPNHGSDFASLRHLLEFTEAFRMIVDKKKDAADSLTSLVKDGMGKAGDDLRPGSLFLDRLGQKTIPEDITWGIIAGTGGLMTQEQHKEFIKWLEQKKEKIEDPLIQMAFSNVVSDIVRSDAVVNGRGDMVVSVESAKMEGADLFKLFPVNHLNVISGGPESDVFKQIRAFLLPGEATEEKEQEKVPEE